MKTTILTLSVLVSLFAGLSACSSSNNSSDTPMDVVLPEVVPLDEVRDQLIIDLAGYPIETLSEEVVLLGENIAANAAPGTTLEAGSFLISVRDEAVTTPTQRRRYVCPLGGTVTADIGRLVISESSYSNAANHDSYQFDQCRVDANGLQILNGAVRTLNNTVSGSGGGFDNRDVEWIDFRWQQANGSLYFGTALIDINRLLSTDNQESRIGV